MASNGVTRPPALDVTMQEILDALKAVSFRPQVIDNLTSQDTGAPLSANQGRVLKDAIDDIVTQSITDGDTSHAPSGDAVHDAINAISDEMENVCKSHSIISQNTPTSSSIGSLNWLRTNYPSWFKRGSIINFTNAPMQGYRTVIIGGTDIDYFLAMELDYYYVPPRLYRFSNGTWTTYEFVLQGI